MQIKLKETPEQVELIRAMGSKNPTVAREATEAIANFIGPVIKKILETAGTAAKIYTDVEYDEDADPSIPLDLFYNEGTGYVQVWSQNQAGGLPTSQIEGVKEVKFGSYRLDSAVSWNKKYARKSRLDVVSKAIEKMVQEVLVKQEKNGWAVILKALAEAATNTQYGGQLKHVLASATGGSFVLADLNSLMVRIKRINESFSGNTPVAPYSYGITDLYISPEVKSQIRAFAYNPVDTSASNTKQFIPEDLRMEIYKNPGSSSIYGVNLTEMIEFGLNQKYNILFNQFASAVGNVAGHSTGSWGGSNGDQILVGVDNTRGAFLRPLARQSESGGTFTVLPDGQFDMYGSRVEKVGLYGFLEESRMCIDARAVVGIVV
jgi:hypothetical protein